MNFLVVMAGGSGTRFWPKSTKDRPKQLLKFGASDSAPTLLQQTLSRFDEVVPDEQKIIVTTELLKNPVLEQAPKAKVLAEPAGRNTAPCVYWAARVIAEQDPKAIMMVMPADHYVPDQAAFRKTLLEAVAWAEAKDDLVTLGVQPTRPETGYGYLHVGTKLQGNALKVEKFVEKPDAEKAKTFLESGDYLWNGGMFLWRAETILKAFDDSMPDYKKIWESCGGDVAQAYPKMEATSIDFGVMERASNVVTFPLDCGWDDLGSWPSLENLAQVLGANIENNTVTGGEIQQFDSQGNIVDVPGKKVSLLGVDNLIIVENGGDLMIARKDRAQEIKKFAALTK